MSVWTFYKNIYKKYRVAYAEHCFQEFRKLSCAKIKALWKLSMKRWFAQYKEQQALDDRGMVYRLQNRNMIHTRQCRRVKL